MKKETIKSTKDLPVVEAPAVVILPKAVDQAPSTAESTISQSPQKPASNVPYIVAVITIATLVMFAIVLISIFRKEDNTILIATIIGFATPTTLSLLSFMKAQETHLSVNSRLDSFITAAEVAAKSSGLIEGNLQGRKEANKRSDDLKTQI